MSHSDFSVLVWCAYAAISIAIIGFGWWAVKRMGSTTSAGARAGAAGAGAPLRSDHRQSGLKSDILAEGTGPGAKNRDLITVQYTAWLPTGEQVDSSYERGRALTFKLGTAAVIFGWDEALKGARVGEKRKVTVPPQMAYGKKGTARVPPNATIIFEIEVIKIEPA